MDKISKKILQEMNRKENPSSYICLFTLDQNSEYAQFAQTIGIDLPALQKCVNLLVEMGYLAYAGAMNRSGYCSFTLTHKGIHYREFQWIDVKEFLRNSIITPIIVSIITSLTTTLLLQLLSWQ